MKLAGEGLACARGERQVFAGVNFTLGPGEMLLARGPNGSGKSSFLRVVAGLLHPGAGTLRVDGSVIHPGAQLLTPHLIYIGHQDPVKPSFSVEENLLFWMGMAGHAVDFRRGGQGGLKEVTRSGRVEAALEAFGLAGLGQIPARFLSAGQKRRLNLARLAAIPRPLWLLDEPATSLDSAAQELLAASMQRHRQQGGLIIAVSHTDLGGGEAAHLLNFGSLAMAEHKA